MAQPPFLLEQQGESPFQLQTRVLAGVVVAVGAMGLLGQLLHAPALQAIVPGAPSMRGNTAVTLIAAGAALWLQAAREAAPGRLRWGRALGVFVLVAGGASLAQDLSGRDLGIDTLLFEATSDPGPNPGRMAPNTALAFVMGGSVLALLDLVPPSAARALEAVDLLIFSSSFAAVCGHAYGAHALTGLAGYVSMAIPTAAGLLALSAGLLLARPRRGLVAVLAGTSAAAAGLRRLLPLVLFTPLSLGLLQLWGRDAGLYSVEFGLALLVTSSTLLLVGVIFRSAATQSEAEVAREQVLGDERFLLEGAERLRATSDMAEALERSADQLGQYLGAARCVFLGAEAPEAPAEAGALSVPLTRGGQRVATLLAWPRGRRPWTPREVALAQAVAQRTWLWVEHLEARARERTTQLRMQALIEASAQIVLTTDPEGRIVEDSPSWRAFTGQTVEQFKSLARRAAVHPDDLDDALAAWREAKRAKRTLHVEYRLRRADGEWRWMLVRAVPRLGPGGELLEWVQMITDVTQHKLDELALRRSEERFRLLVAGAREYATMTLDPEGRITSWNLGAERLFGYDAAEVIGKNRTILYPADDPQVEDDRAAAKREGSVKYEAWRVRKDGSRFLAEVVLTALRQPDGTLVGFGKVTRDTTEQRRGQEEKEALMEELRQANAELERRVQARTETLSAMLGEREVLLQEIHHRVKNNLQMISSLINMQARVLPAAEARSGLDDCRRRVEAIALIHEDLYRSRDYARVPFGEHARTLVTNIVQSSAHGSRIELSVQVEPVFLSVDQAIPCGLILNELVTNALKHAFPGDRPGTITVEFKRTGPGQLQLFVGDDGIGVSADFDPHATASLGMRLVCLLIDQLDGSLEVSRGKGSGFRITFPGGEGA